MARRRRPERRGAKTCHSHEQSHQQTNHEHPAGKLFSQKESVPEFRPPRTASRADRKRRGSPHAEAQTSRADARGTGANARGRNLVARGADPERPAHSAAAQVSQSRRCCGQNGARRRLPGRIPQSGRQTGPHRSQKALNPALARVRIQRLQTRRRSPGHRATGQPRAPSPRRTRDSAA